MISNIQGGGARVDAVLDDLTTNDPAPSPELARTETNTTNAKATAAGTYYGVPERVPAQIDQGQTDATTELAWASRVGFYVHRRVTLEVIGGELSPAEQQALANAHVIADGAEFQGVDSTHRHAMRRPLQTIDEARWESNQFVRQQFSRAWNAGTRIEALTEFGIALHALQDSTSPVHAGCQLWSGTESRFQEFNHVRNELFDPGPDSELHRATQQAWEWFNNGSLPDGDLFIFGCDGCTA